MKASDITDEAFVAAIPQAALRSLHPDEWRALHEAARIRRGLTA